MAQTVLSPNAQKIIDAAIKAANAGGGTDDINRAVDDAVNALKLKLAPPYDSKLHISEEAFSSLLEITKVYVQSKVGEDSLEGSFSAVVAVQGRFGPGMILELTPPVRNIKYAVVNPDESKGFIDFWNKVGNREPKGVQVIITKMKPGPEAFMVEQFSIAA